MNMETLVRSIAESLAEKHGIDDWNYTWGYDNFFWVRFNDGSQFNIDIRQTKEAKS